MAQYFSFVTKHITDVSENNGNRPVAVRDFEKMFQGVIDHGGTFIESILGHIDGVATDEVSLILCKI